MKLIKKSISKLPVNKPIVGDVVRIKFYYFDGRVTECYIESVTVVKVNRVTFDFKKDNGDIYRINNDDFDIVGNGPDF